MHMQHVPYVLVTSPAQFLSLVPGRRKAIEVGSCFIRTIIAIDVAMLFDSGRVLAPFGMLIKLIL